MINIRKNNGQRKWWYKVISLARKIACSYITILYLASLSEKVLVADPLSSVLDDVSRPDNILSTDGRVIIIDQICLVILDPLSSHEHFLDFTHSVEVAGVGFLTTVDQMDKRITKEPWLIKLIISMPYSFIQVHKISEQMHSITSAKPFSLEGMLFGPSNPVILYPNSAVAESKSKLAQ